jgi:hypothetical protein
MRWPACASGTCKVTEHFSSAASEEIERIAEAGAGRLVVGVAGGATGFLPFLGFGFLPVAAVAMMGGNGVAGGKERWDSTLTIRSVSRVRVEVNLSSVV